MVTKIGLDLGYANITLSNLTAEVYREPSVVLVDKNTRRILSVGSRAILGDESLPSQDGLLVRPFKNGLLYSSDITREIIKNAVSAVGKIEKIRCVISLPSDFVPKQENEVFQMLNEAGVAECFSVKPAVAAIIGAGYSPDISCVSVNIGASVTEIAVMHEGQVLISAREQIGGENFDKAVKQYIFDQGDMTVSLLVARTIKESLGAVWHGRPSETIEIDGTLSMTGNKIRMSISTEDIVGVFEKPLKELLRVIANAVKKIPVNAIEAVLENGIVLSGGGAELFGLDSMMAKVFEIPVTKANKPIDCVSKGLARINSFIPVKTRMNNKNITSMLSKYYNSKNQK